MRRFFDIIRCIHLKIWPPVWCSFIISAPKEHITGYHIKHEFDEIDRKKFEQESFETFRDYFEAKIADANNEKMLQGRFNYNKPYKFGDYIQY